MAVLKGGISNTRYIWHATEGACEKCQELNGTEYDYEGDIPDRPHPNCQCWVEAVSDDEPCDCQENIELIEEMLGDGQSLLDETEAVISDIESFLSDNIYLLDIFVPQGLALIKQAVKNLEIIGQSVAIFIDNFFQLLAVNDGSFDKYYHAKANCEAAQLGITGETTAKILSDAKELFDMTVKATLEAINMKKDLTETILNKVKDSEEDQETNREGREVGRQNPDGVCGEILRYKIPEGKR